MNFSSSDTIAAVSSPHGSSWRGILRLSGPEAMAAVSSCLKSPVDLKSVASSSSLRTDFTLPEPGHAVPVWLYIMRSPHSYTGEDLVEIHTIGGTVMLEAMQRVLCHHPSVRPAGSGEFTLRAFLNGRLSLMRAESVMDVIQSQSEEDLISVHAQASGPLSFRLHDIEDRLLNLCAEIEAAIDFTDQDIEIVSESAVRTRLGDLARSAQEVMDQSGLRSVADDRYKILLYGAPNVGKSTLFNRLVPQGRVIVSEVAGTTRDVIEGRVEFDSVPCSVFDSAGVFEGPAGVDAEAVRLTRHLLRSMDLVLFMIDATDLAPSMKLLASLPETDRMTVINKCDQTPDDAAGGPDAIRISARSGEGIDRLRQRIVERIRARGGQQGGAIFRWNQRQGHAFQQALAAMHRACDAAEEGRGLEFLASDMREALGHLGALTGRRVTDDILHRIFDRFCIGK